MNYQAGFDLGDKTQNVWSYIWVTGGRRRVGKMSKIKKNFMVKRVVSFIFANLFCLAEATYQSK